MPEVSEVALTAEVLHKKLKGKELVRFNYLDRMFKKKNSKGLKSFLNALPLTLNKVDSKGKLMWFEFDDGWYVWNSFRLNGMWSFEETKFAHVELEFDDGTVVYYDDSRKLGTFNYSDDEDEFEKVLDSLGPDVLKTRELDLSSITKYKSAVVKLLMDQKKLVSGIGNYLVAEILYDAKLDPRKLGSELTKSEIKRLTSSIKKIVKLSYVNNHVGYMTNLSKATSKMKRKNYHPEIEIADDEFEFKVYGQKKDPLGNKVKRDKINGQRTTHWVPNVQK